MKATTLIFALSMITTTGLSGMAVAHQQNDDGKHHQRSMQHAKPLQRALSSLDLTDSQQTQIKQLMQQHRAQQKAKPGDNITRQQLQGLVTADSFDEVAARQLLELQQQQKVERQLAGLKLKHDILQLLTAEQRQQLTEKQKKWQQKRQQRQTS
ncbi:Spy/CpxP family protein refolding chaperone [Rheinheimera maricola]|uniref:Spy/CpxP family protein refolding chaperone n=1 Tax=Rheinheimera maricola TaxID=2793282 RepID=A0ABS7X6R0_9GAMM|nr:Spy/CpxP family protein refolding chaperone [Rheinheimera maricola]MBZ9611229.1 Spy/CpxP family protein refolding chaperone [Rheinheimera maricola]